MSDTFTPSSNVGFDANESFSLGMEVFFQTQGSPAVVVREFDVPSDLTVLTIFSGSAAMRPRDPECNTFGKWKFYKADHLYRVWLDDIMIINIIQKTTMEPVVTSISSFTYTTFLLGDNRKMRVEFQSAGAGTPINAELQLCGKWQ